MNTELAISEQQRLETYEATIERGLHTFVEVGKALMAIRDDPDKLYRKFGTFEDYCRDRWGMNYHRVWELTSASEVVSNLKTLSIDNVLPTTESQARPLTSLPVEIQSEAWQEAVNTAPNGKITAAHVAQVATKYKPTCKQCGRSGRFIRSDGLCEDCNTFERAKQNRYSGKPLWCNSCHKWHSEWGQVFIGGSKPIAYICLVCQVRFASSYIEAKRAEQDKADAPPLIGETKVSEINGRPPANKALFTSNSQEWYTPPRIIEAVRQVMGGIDLDPASSDEANKTVQAKHYFTIEMDGLKRDWFAPTLFMNPPYGDTIGDWVDKLAREYAAKHFKQAITLLPARTDTAWLHKLSDFPRCFISGRLKFSGSENSATFPSVVIYLGPEAHQFGVTFSELGDIYVAWKQQ